MSRAICPRREQESPVPGESAKDTIKTIAQGRPVVRPNLWLLPPAFLFAGGPWVRPAPGLPCALSLWRDTCEASLGRDGAARTRTRILLGSLTFKSESSLGIVPDKRAATVPALVAGERGALFFAYPARRSSALRSLIPRAMSNGDQWLTASQGVARGMAERR